MLQSLSGVQTVAYAFPKVKIVSTACDTQLDPSTGFICPGLGNFGDRYFGTGLPNYSSDNDEVLETPTGDFHFQGIPPSPSIESKRSPYNQNTNLSPSLVVKSFHHENFFNGV